MEMDILEKIAYIKGLAEGLSLDATKPEGKVLSAIIDLLGDLCETVADIDDEVCVLGDYVEELDHDLGAVEEDLYADDDECDCGCGCGPDCDCGCQDGYECTCGGDCDCGCDCEFDEDDLVEAMCPHCAEKVVFCSDIPLDELVCPACGEPFATEE